ncbi:hypothetical protein BD779DRAFT_905704 [Infundibulicybe gibba]|nr:hypothetical protein BD779DRAFT_905704 [Infundibulicybe gibba]
MRVNLVDTLQVNIELGGPDGKCLMHLSFDPHWPSANACAKRTAGVRGRMDSPGSQSPNNPKRSRVCEWAAAVRSLLEDTCPIIMSTSGISGSSSRGTKNTMLNGPFRAPKNASRLCPTKIPSCSTHRPRARANITIKPGLNVPRGLHPSIGP